MPIIDTSMLTMVCAIAVEAGRHIMECRERFTKDHIQIKEDNSPVTLADQGASEIIVAALTKRWPDIPAISEESERFADIRHASRFWLIDPLDGTKGFIRGENEFTVNIGLVEMILPSPRRGEDGRGALLETSLASCPHPNPPPAGEGTPVLGVIYLPAQGVLYYGARGMGAFRRDDGGAEQPIHVRKPPKEGLTAVASTYHASPDTETFLSRYQVAERMSASSSLKFCAVAEGKADIYPRLGRTMEWDTAAGHAIVEAAGGTVTTLEGQPFLYGKDGFANGGFVVVG